MKTAISVPDATYERVTRRAAELGMSRSEFFAKAAGHYLDALDDESLTRAIDDALAAETEADDTNAVAAAAGRLRLADSEW